MGGRRRSCSHCGRTWAPGSRKASLPQLCDSGATAASASENQGVDGGQGTFLSLHVASEGPSMWINDATAAKMWSLSPALTLAVVFSSQAQ